jgi:5'-nucleotidase
MPITKGILVPAIALTLIAVGGCSSAITTSERAVDSAKVVAPSRLKILLSNDDGLTENIRALRQSLLDAGYDVILSVPCQNQSGKGAASTFLQPIAALSKDCRGAAAKAGAPGVGAITALDHSFYVDGTPVMATLYGIDIGARKVWNSAPDLVISGPNEGQNLGGFVIGSGTVSNAQIALLRGIPALAISADLNTTNNAILAKEIADLTTRFVVTLQQHLKHLVPNDVALNINFPKFDSGQGAQLKWRATHFGNFEWASVRFTEDLNGDSTATAFGLKDLHGPGISFTVHKKTDATPSTDIDSEALQSLNGFVTVTPMQQGYEMAPERRGVLGHSLQSLFENQ